ncbi:hypothetical protein [Gelidibacter sp.]|nr:hypothetical protein [Gelidibacter sp.]HUH29160.1 hypothetical protein [Gelidibacter sp.]
MASESYVLAYINEFEKECNAQFEANEYDRLMALRFVNTLKIGAIA